MNSKRNKLTWKINLSTGIPESEEITTAILSMSPLKVVCVNSRLESKFKRHILLGASL
jgi:hypothetical protein